MNFPGLKRLLGGLVDVRREELPRILPLALANGLVMVSLYVLKPARNALFLDRLGVAQLPYVLLLVALVGGLAAGVFTRLTRIVRLDWLILGTFLFLMTNLLGFRLLLPQGWSWSFYLFYIWVSLYGLLATSLLWLLANVTFNPREARRLFGLISSGGIAGAILGGAFTGWIVERVGTENLLLICIAFLGACLLLLYCVRSTESAPQRRKESTEGALTSIARSDLLRLLGTMAALAAVVAAVIDVQFNDIVDRTFADKDAKTAFFGQFFAYLNAFVFAFQVLGTPRILGSLGVVSALLFLPVSMAVGSLAVLLAPGLAAGILLKSGDVGFRHSLHKSATEILFLPVPAEVKQRTKVLLDATVDHLATGLGAALVLLLTVSLGISYQHLGFLSLALLALWVGLVFRGREAYIDAFRQALERREIDLGQLTVDINEAAALNSLIVSLDSSNERQVVYALDMLSSVRARRLVEPVQRLLGHGSAEVRQRAIRVLCNQGGAEHAEEIEPLLQDEDLGVRIEVLYCLCTQDAGGPQRQLREALQSADPKLRSAAVGYIAEYGTEARELIDEGLVEELLAGGESDRVQAAKIIGTVDRSAWRPHLERLLEDPSPEVVAQAIASLGQIRDAEHVPYLLEKLADRRFRRVARHALVAYGAAALGSLEACLRDARQDAVIRQGVTRVLSDVFQQGSVDLLLNTLGQVEPQLEYLLIKSLSRLRTSGADLKFDSRRVRAALEREIEAYCEILQILQLFGDAGEGKAVRLLRKVLREKQEQTLERIFRLLGLQYPPRDMYHAYLGLVSSQPRVRASALEFLDNVLYRQVKERLLPLLDSVSPEAAIEHGEQLFGARLQSREQALARMLDSRDTWLRACAVYSVVESESAEQVELVRQARDDPHELVREAAAAVLR